MNLAIYRERLSNYDSDPEVIKDQLSCDYLKKILRGTKNAENKSKDN